MHVGAVCSTCPNQGFIVIVILVVIAVVFAVVLFLARNVGSGKRSLRVSLIKILIVHAQMLSILASFAFVWPTNSALGLGFLSTGGTMSFSSFLDSIVCVSPVPFYAKYYLVLFSPAIFLIFIVPTVLLYRHHFLTQIQIHAVVLVSLMLCHPFVTAMALSIFQCAPYGSVQYLVADVAVECSGPGYQFSQAVGAFFLIGYSTGLPLAVLYLAARKSSRNNEKTSILTADYCFSYLSCGFTDKVWFWEVIVIFRKAMFAVLATFSSWSTQSEGNAISLGAVFHLAACLLSLLFFLHTALNPYPSRTLNGFDSAAQYLLILSLVAAYTITNNPNSSTFDDGVAWTVVVLNVIFFATVLIVLMQPVVAAVGKRVDSVRRSFQKGRRSTTSFTATEMQEPLVPSGVYADATEMADHVNLDSTIGESQH